MEEEQDGVVGDHNITRKEAEYPFLGITLSGSGFVIIAVTIPRLLLLFVVRKLSFPSSIRAWYLNCPSPSLVKVFQFLCYRSLQENFNAVSRPVIESQLLAFLMGTWFFLAQ